MLEAPATIDEQLLEQKRAQVVSVFNTINTERMNDIPILNHKLSVSLIGLQEWNNNYLGILVTPWFMNIIMLPNQADEWSDIPELSSEKYVFPSGNYKFLMGFEPDIGKYQTCSLFSPMFEFADNQAAIETAQAAITELMNDENIETTDIDSEQIQRIWEGEELLPEGIRDGELTNYGTTPKTALSEEAEPVATVSLEERMHEPISRRKLLRGAFLNKNEVK
ncbi:MAG TPA: [NiFe]-hydrogenase assembly, chaperone, HybE [Methylophaga sp.]|nr:[NiFe]-hydrogenase assembly, chaperone, HybE [Methylophaga sp.]